MPFVSINSRIFDAMSREEQDSYFAYETRLSTLAGRVIIGCHLFKSIVDLPSDILDTLVLIPRDRHNSSLMACLYRLGENQFLSIYRKLSNYVQIQIPNMMYYNDMTIFQKVLIDAEVSILNAFLESGYTLSSPISDVSLLNQIIRRHSQGEKVFFILVKHGWLSIIDELENLYSSTLDWEQYKIMEYLLNTYPNYKTVERMILSKFHQGYIYKEKAIHIAASSIKDKRKLEPYLKKINVKAGVFISLTPKNLKEGEDLSSK